MVEKFFENTDTNGNTWKFGLKKQEGYLHRYDLFFEFNGKKFKIRTFASHRDAEMFWELIESSKINLEQK